MLEGLIIFDANFVNEKLHLKNFKWIFRRNFEHVVQDPYP